MSKKRLLISVLSGAILGVFCVLGASYRLEGQYNQLLLFSLWYNRVLLGLVIGLAGELTLFQGKLNSLVRGALLGLVLSAPFFFTTGASDWVSFLAGPVYGMIIELILTRWG